MVYNHAVDCKIETEVAGLVYSNFASHEVVHTGVKMLLGAQFFELDYTI